MQNFHAQLDALTKEHGLQSIIFKGVRHNGTGMIAVVKTKKGHHRLLCHFPGRKNASQGVATKFLETSRGFELTAEIDKELFILRAHKNPNHLSTLAGVKFKMLTMFASA